MQEPFYELPEAERIALTRAKKAENQPLMIRWADMPTSQWSQRSETVARLLENARSVVDIGCGSMSLEKSLRPDQKYIPVDIARRDKRTVVLDINRDEGLAQLPDGDAAALLGVLEYAYSPARVIAALRKYRLVVITFNVLEGGPSMNEREGHGWVVHFTKDELIHAFRSAGFELGHSEKVTPPEGQWVFSFR